MLTSGFEVLVIGEGMAGLMAAVAAAKQGACVALVNKGPGSFVLADDCIDFATVDSHRLGSEDGCEEEIRFFLQTAAAAGCEYQGRTGATITIPTLLGTFRQVTFAPSYFGGCDRRDVKRVAVAGFPSISDFDANFVAERLAARARSECSSTSYRALQLLVSFPGEPPRLEIQFAAQFDRNPKFREAVIAALAVAASGSDLLIIPGVLGINTTSQELKEIWRRVGCPVCEVATLPPSVLGVRLLRLLETYLRKLGVELFTGFAVKKLWVEGAKYRGVVLNSPGRPQRLEARTIVLATGRFSHLIDASGDRLVPGNVFVCGGALNLSDPRTENAVAVVTGFRAGMRAAKLGAQPCGKMTGDSITA